jgi:hypothetical protein
MLGYGFRPYQRIGLKKFLHHSEQADLAGKIRTFVLDQPTDFDKMKYKSWEIRTIG